MRRTFGVVAWGILGAVVAVALITGAFAVAGTRLTQPASAVRVVTGTPLRANMHDRHDADPTQTVDDTPASPSSVAPPASSVAAVSRAPTVPVASPSEDGGAERHDD
jgi:hypothetical protein